MFRRNLYTTLVWATMIAAALLILSPRVSAQNQPEEHFTFNVGGGFTPPAGNLSRDFKTGWHMTAGAGYRITSPFSIGLQFGYNHFGLTQSFINSAGTPGGNARLWRLTVDPMLRLTTIHSVQPYIVGGVGFYRRTVDFTRPVLQSVLFFDPFFGLFPGTVPADQVLKSMSSNAIGGNLGAGFSFGLPHSNRARLFAEARYHYAATRPAPTRLIPVTFGIQF